MTAQSVNPLQILSNDNQDPVDSSSYAKMCTVNPVMAKFPHQPSLFVHPEELSFDVTPMAEHTRPKNPHSFATKLIENCKNDSSIGAKFGSVVSVVSAVLTLVSGPIAPFTGLLALLAPLGGSALGVASGTLRTVGKWVIDKLSASTQPEPPGPAPNEVPSRNDVILGKTPTPTCTPICSLDQLYSPIDSWYQNGINMQHDDVTTAPAAKAEQNDSLVLDGSNQRAFDFIK